MVLAKCGKISNTQVIGSTVTTVLKRLSQLSGKAVTTIMKKLSQLSGKVVTAVMLFALSKSQWGQMGDFRLFERSFHGFGWKMARSLWRVLGYFFFFTPNFIWVPPIYTTNKLLGFSKYFLLYYSINHKYFISHYLNWIII